MLDTVAKKSDYKVVGTRPIRPDGVDKVTGRARFGADLNLPGQLVGRVLRSPHPHARLVSIDVSAAAALDGVKAIVTREDFADQPPELTAAGEMMLNYRDVVRNVLAREKVLYEGHAIAAVAAISAAIARKALRLIRVDYEILPHVTDVVAAMAPDAPLLDEAMITAGVTPTPTTPSNIAKRVDFGHGDIDTGFAQADVIVEREFRTESVHQGYIEPQACVANVAEDGQAELFVTTQGQWIVRGHCAKLLGWNVNRIKVTAAEMGGGFGGKTVVYLEPLALALSAKARRPVKMVMTREEVLKATGPTSAARVRVKVGAKKDGRITAAFAECAYGAGAFAGSPAGGGAMCAFAPYELEHVATIGLDVLTNRPKVSAYRAPGAPIAAFAVESVLDEIARTIGVDPIDLRLKNAAKVGTRSTYGPTFAAIGFVELLQAAKAHPHYSAPLPAGQGRGVAAGFWFNVGGDTAVQLTLNEDASVTLTAGTPDVGGLRASLGMMVSEELGIPLDKIRTQIGDTASLAYNFVTGGSRSTFASGMASVEAARAMVKELAARAAKIWDIPVDAVKFEDGMLKPAGDNAGKYEPMSIRDIARQMAKTGGPIVGYATLNAQGAAPGLAFHIVDTQTDPETGKTTILRYTALQDVGRAIHPAFVEGQMQGGVAQGIGWALNEEYVYGADGRMQNAGFLDYRVPVASDLPMIDTVMVEVPNPRHPYGVKGVGEAPIVPPMAAIANAVARGAGVRFTQLPMSPPRVLAALSGQGAR
ncbi:MAG: xanthine dehydrogenase family protein molybdopterin-binding subunit [Methylobacteriaceae bacterium]|nr:xanthine dehydrogenase family protein molybdopterin-binding subunit [Methylobacteriaceae bacterium]